LSTSPHDPDPQRACDGLSLGLGFDFVRVQVPTPADFIDEPLIDVCSEP
jgi:hypothetical protein